VCKSVGNIPLLRPGNTLEDNIKKKFEIMLEGVDLIHFYFSFGGQLRAVTNVISDLFFDMLS
jgi:hypothetical protein